MSKEKAPIQVEVKLIGMFSNRQLSLAENLSLDSGATVKDSIKTLYKIGKIEKQIYKRIKRVRFPTYLMINGEKTDHPSPGSIRLKDGDSISILQALSGG